MIVSSWSSVMEVQVVGVGGNGGLDDGGLCNGCLDGGGGGVRKTGDGENERKGQT